MMKFEEATMEIIELEPNDVLATSSSTVCTPDMEPIDENEGDIVLN